MIKGHRHAISFLSIKEFSLRLILFSELFIAVCSSAMTCREVFELTPFKGSDAFREILEAPWGIRWLRNRPLQSLCRQISFATDLNADPLKTDKQPAIAVLHAAAAAHNRAAFNIILQSVPVLIRGKNSGLTLSRYFGEELAELFRLQPHLLHHWQLLKRMGDWRVGETVLGNFEGWQNQTNTPYGLLRFTINPRDGSGSVSASVIHLPGTSFDTTKPIVERALRFTEHQVGSSIPRTMYEIYSYPDSPHGGVQILLAPFKERTDRSENLLLLGINLQAALNNRLSDQ